MLGAPCHAHNRERVPLSEHTHAIAYHGTSRQLADMFCLGVRNITQVDLGNNKTCHRLLRSDPLTNSCYIPCAEWDWRTESEKQLDLAATYTTMVISIVCVIIAIITWIKLKRL